MISRQRLPWQANDQCLQLLGVEGHSGSRRAFGPDEAAPVETTGDKPEAKAVIHQDLHARAILVGEQVRVMRAGGAKHLHDACQSGVRTGPHI